MTTEHGQFYISINANMIQIKFVGSFNECGAKAAFSELRQIIEELNGVGFLMISDYLEVDGGTPEVFNEIKLNNQWISERNIIAKAILITSEAIKSIGLSRVPQNNINTKFFKCKSKAIQWLMEQSIN